MTPDEDRLTRLGADFLQADFAGDTARRDQLLGEFPDGVKQVGDGFSVELANALAYAAVLGVTMLAQVSSQPFDDVLRSLPEPEMDQLLPPPATVPWDKALDLVAVIPQSNDAAAAAARQMDGPGALNALFAVGLSAWRQLQSRTGRDAAELLGAVLAAPPQS